MYKIQQMLNAAYRYLFVQKTPREIKKKYGIPEKLDWSIGITQDGWFIAECKDIPGIFTQARSKEELLEMINDAVLTYFSVPKKESDYIFDNLRLGNEEVIHLAEARLQTT